MSPDDEEEDTLPDMEGLDTATVAQVAPAAAAAITPVAEPEVEEESLTEIPALPQTIVEEPAVQAADLEITGTTEEPSGE